MIPEIYIALAETYEKMGNTTRATELKQLASQVKPMSRRYRGERTRWSSVVTRRVERPSVNFTGYLSVTCR